MIHPSAIIDHTVQWGDRVTIWQFANIMRGVRLGNDVSIGGSAEIGRDCVIGAETRISYGVFIPNHTKIGARVFIGPRVVMCDDKFPRVNNPKYLAQPPVIEDDVSIGAGAVILPGVTLHRGCTIGAGAVVTRSIPAFGTVIGQAAISMPDMNKREVILRKIVRFTDILMREWDHEDTAPPVVEVKG